MLLALLEEQLTEFLTKLSALTIGQHREAQGSLGYLVVGLFKDLIAGKSAVSKFFDLQKAIVEVGYTSYDLS